MDGHDLDLGDLAHCQIAGLGGDDDVGPSLADGEPTRSSGIRDDEPQGHAEDLISLEQLVGGRDGTVPGGGAEIGHGLRTLPGLEITQRDRLRLRIDNPDVQLLRTQRIENSDELAGGHLAGGHQPRLKPAEIDNWRLFHSPVSALRWN